MAVETIRDLEQTQYGVVLAPRFQTPGLTVQVTQAVLVKQDPSRIALFVSNVGPADVFLIPQGQPPPQRGVLCAANGGTVAADWREDGELVSSEWQAFAVGSPSPVLIVETILQKQLEGTPT